MALRATTGAATQVVRWGKASETDFEHDEEHQAVRELATRIFQENATHERTRDLEAAASPEGPFDRALGTALREAGLRGIGLGTDVGGAGLDFLAVCLVLD